MGERPRIETASQVEAAKPEAKQFSLYDSKVTGLALRVSPGGRKAWSLFYRNATGTARRLPLGTFPTVGLHEARKAGSRALLRVQSGEDPARERQVAKAKARDGSIVTVGQLVDAYLADAGKGRHKPNGRPLRASTLAGYRDYADRLIKPRIGSHAAAELTRAELQGFIRKLGDEESPTAARMCGVLLRAAYNYAIRREIVEKSPALLLDIPKAGKRERVLTDAELRAVWEVASEPTAIGVSRLMGVAVKLAMVTLQRGGEICGINEDEINEMDKIWTLPGERTKNHKVHLVPLPGITCDLIEEARRLRQGSNAYLFPAREGESHIARHSLTQAVERILAHCKIKKATLHDLRRTGATNITGERIGLPRFIVSRVLNQISDTGGAAAVTGIYDRNEYLAEKRKALDAWAELLERIVGEKTQKPK